MQKLLSLLVVFSVVVPLYAMYDASERDSTLISIPLIPAEDTYIDGNAARANITFDNDRTLVLRNENGRNPQRIAFLKFYLPTEAPSQAHLMLFGGLDMRGNGNVAVYASSNNWKSSEMSWNNKVALGEKINQRIVSASQQWYSWDITDYIAETIAEGKTIASIAVQLESSGKAVFTSSNAGSNSPVLRVCL